MKKRNKFSFSTNFAHTLVELIIAVAIVFVIVSLSIPSFIGMEKYTLMDEVDKMFMDLSLLQQRAIASNQEQRVYFNTQNNSYYYMGLQGKKNVRRLAQKIKFGFIKGAKGPPGGKGKAKAITKPINLDYQYDPPQAIFYPDGKITPGTIYMTDKKGKFMCALTFPVGQIAYLRKYAYHGGCWVKTGPKKHSVFGKKVLGRSDVKVDAENKPGFGVIKSDVPMGFT